VSSHSTTGSCHPRHFRKALDSIRHIANSEGDRGAIEGIVREGKSLGVSLEKLNFFPQTGSLHLFNADLQHPC